jgi:alkylation response protein AidB-like acyl-CoA dehydrogenase
MHQMTSTEPTNAGFRTWDGLGISVFDPASVADEIAEFAEGHRMELREAERSATFPREIYHEMGRRGWVGTITPSDQGGLGGGPAEYCFVQEATTRHGLTSPQISIQGQRWLLEWGTPHQRAKYLAGIADASLIFSESISEPHAGSSFRNMRATARRVADGWVIDGAKTHVNLGADCDVTIIYAVAAEGLTSFMVDMDTPGVSATKTDPIGLRMLPTADVVFDGVHVGEEALLGPLGGGLDTFLSVFNLSRLGNASELIGLARRGLVIGLDYARQRQVGKNMVTDFQGIQWKVADCYARIYAAALGRERAVRAAERDDPDLGLATALAKNLAIDAAEDVGRDMFSLVGGHGLYHDQDFAAILHDIKVLRVAGGSQEVLRNFVNKNVLASDTYLGLR